MVRPKSDKSNLINVTVRLEEKYLSDLKLYAQVVGKSQSEVLRSIVIEALLSIPEHQRQVMSVITTSRQAVILSDTMPDTSTKHESFFYENTEG